MEAKIPKETTALLTRYASFYVSCAICNEFYTTNDFIYSIAICGHVFHKECLHRWMDCSPSCPQCRKPCQRQEVHRISFNFAKRTKVKEVERQVQWIPLDLKDSQPSSFELECAVQCGTDHNGYNTYVARVSLYDDLLPANYVPELKAVYTPWNCSAHKINTKVELLTLTDCEVTWVTEENGYVLENALKTGYSETGEQLYTGRAVYNGRTLLGKIHPSHGVIYMPFERKEVNSRTYEILVVTPREQNER